MDDNQLDVFRSLRSLYFYPARWRSYTSIVLTPAGFWVFLNNWVKQNPSLYCCKKGLWFLSVKMRIYYNLEVWLIMTFICSNVKLGIQLKRKGPIWFSVVFLLRLFFVYLSDVSLMLTVRCSPNWNGISCGRSQSLKHFSLLLVKSVVDVVVFLAENYYTVVFRYLVLGKKKRKPNKWSNKVCLILCHKHLIIVLM